MSKTIWRIYIDYGDCWVPVQWAPTFNTEEEANNWINDDHDWESPIKAIEEEIEED